MPCGYAVPADGPLFLEIQRFTAAGPNDPADHPHKGAFPGPVRAEEARDTRREPAWHMIYRRFIGVLLG